ncbi:S8 family serine peptidase [Kumtagia ephedrae]|nr:S8 family serine peptidase [Mesorhizobium ephedrae]
MYRPFLKAAAEACSDPESQTLTPGIVRFTLEYREAPDPKTERDKLSRIIGGDRFAFFPLPPGEDPLIHVLQFPGVIRQQSAGFLFDVAQGLVGDCGLVSCVPDVDPGWITDDELGHQAPESVGGIVWTLCRSHAPAPQAPRWAVSAVRADRAWEAFGTTGQGIVIGQPDTGVADHRELDGAIDIRRGTDTLAGGGLPIDPLSPTMASPGHGTATSSAAVSRPSMAIVGAAPGATLVPIRCTNSVIIGSGAAVAAAIDHARLAGCHIVTMSLGGPIEGADLRRAIDRAVKAGMIVLAAAGNCVHAVLYPAWDANVIAVAAVDADDRAWRGTSHGPKVDISAPGENVYVARRHWPADADKSLVEPGQGTSFAVAIAAGCAALWLSRHSPDAVQAEAEKRGVSVQELFRAAIKATARRPENWPSQSLGAGVVDAEQLLGLPLARVSRPVPSTDANPGRSMLEGVADAERFLAEAGFLALDRRQRTDPTRVGALESAAAPRPSQALEAAIRRSGGGELPAERSARSAAVAPLTPYIGPRKPSAKILAQGAVATGASSASRAASVREGKKALLDRIESVLKSQVAQKRRRADADRIRHEIMSQAERVIDSWAHGTAIPADVLGAARSTAEMIVRITDRPAVPVVEGSIDLDRPELALWAGELEPAHKLLKPLIDAVGRIDIGRPDGHVHVGTGTVIGDGLIMTNRHVIEAFCEPIPSSDGTQKFLLNAPVSICFDEAALDESRRFVVKDVLTAGPWRIGEVADVGKLDIAVLEVETTNAAGARLPAPAPSGRLPVEAGNRSGLVVVGYPARPVLSADTATGETADPWAQVQDVFDDAYGTKHLSVGRIVNKPGEIVGDERGWAFTHDATTLAGNSGAAVISLRRPYRIGGLHFGGQALRQNFAHDLSAIRTVVRDERQMLDLAAFGGFLDIP